jgi:cyanate lyase
MPYQGSLPTAVPTDPLIYRFYELANVYGTTFKALIHEEFGNGITRAIDFDMDLTREPDPKGDLVSIVMSGQVPPVQDVLMPPATVTRPGGRATAVVTSFASTAKRAGRHGACAGREALRLRLSGRRSCNHVGALSAPAASSPSARNT